MPVNRYELPAQQQVANTYVNLPYQELLLAGQSMQKQSDDLEAKRLEFADKKLYGLSPDEQVIKDGYNWLQTETDKIADLYGKDFRQAQQQYKTFEREAKKRLGQYGDLGSAMSNYDAFYGHLKKEEERMKANKVNPLQIEKWKESTLKQYADQGGIGSNPNQYQGIGLENLANYVSPTEFADKYGKGFMSSMTAFADVYPTGDGQFIFKKKGTEENVTESQIENTLLNYAKGDPELLHYLEQGKRMGYSNSKMLNDAITGAITKYGFSKETYDENLSTNSNYGRALDEKEKYSNVITGTNVEDTGAIPKTNWLGMPIANNYQNEVKNKQQTLQSIDNEINRYQQMLASGSNATDKSKAGAITAIKNLENQKQQLAAEINTDNQIIESITESTVKQIFPNSIATGDNIKVNADIVLTAKTQYENYKKTVHPSEINSDPTLLAYKKYYEDAVNGFGESTGIFDDLKYKNSTTEEKAKIVLDLSKQVNENIDKNIQSYHENKVTYTPTLQIIDGKNKEATTIKNHVINNPNQYNFQKLVNGKKVNYNPNISNANWLNPNSKTTTELVNIVADGKNTSQYVVKDASGKIIETYYASPKNPESVAAVYNNYYEKIGPNGLFFKETTNNPSLHNILLKKTNQLAQTYLSSSIEKDITSEHTFNNGTKAVFDVDGATAGSYNLTLYDKAGNVVPMELPDGTITDFTTTDYTNLFLILNEFEKQQ